MNNKFDKYLHKISKQIVISQVQNIIICIAASISLIALKAFQIGVFAQWSWWIVTAPLLGIPACILWGLHETCFAIVIVTTITELTENQSDS